MSERRDTSAPGQALEFEIWSDLIKQSHGALHVFLPLLDRGLDAVLHRMTDGRYIPLQVKGRGKKTGNACSYRRPTYRKSPSRTATRW